jgi:L-threonylcarbamoyladenylate synthase
VAVIVDARGDPPPKEALAAGVGALRGGDIVGVPTDTVYGLAADPWRSGASDRLFRLKGRPRSVELPVFVAGPEQAAELVTGMHVQARRLMEAFWPGPLTIVVPRRPDLDADLGEEDATIGLRCPGHPVPLALCREYGPFATTSANRHGRSPATTAAELVDQLPGVDLVLDGGRCDQPPSTVVDATGDVLKLLREGRLPWEAIAKAAGG